MADNRTMAEMLRAPTEGCAEAIVVHLILVEQFELKHSLINMMTSKQFFGLKKDNSHDHICWFNKITSTIKYKYVPNSVIKLILFPFSLVRAARRWLEKEPPRSITTWDDLVSKFINKIFLPSRTTNLQNEISNFQQKFDESFHEAWDRYKDLLRACPHHSFTEWRQLDTFYNALNPADQDSLNAVAGRNLLEKSPQDALTIIENKSKVRNSRSKPIPSQVKACDVNSNSEIAMLTHAVNQQTSVVTNAMTAMLKQLQATPTPAPVKAVEEIYVTCGGAHPYYQCLTAGGSTFPEFRDNIQGYVSAAASNYNQDNLGSGSLPSNTVANPKGKLKAITTRSGHVTDGPTVPTSPNPLLQRDFIVHKRDSLPPNIPYPSRMLKQKQQEKDEVQIQKFCQMFKQLHLNITLAEALVLMPKYQKMLKDLLSNKEKLQELANTPLKENCSAIILKKLPEKLGDPGKFLIPCDFSELKCKALADLGASINLMLLSVLKELGLHELIPSRMTLELANRAICTPAGIARDDFFPVGRFTFLTDFVVVDYESDPRVPLILGRPFLRNARALIDVHVEEMILRDDFFKVSVSKQPSGNPTFTLHQKLTSSKVTCDIHDSEGCNVLFEKLPYIDYSNDIHPYFDDNPLSGSTTYSSNSLLEEFTDELALITYPSNYDDNLQFDIESDLKEIEFLHHQGKDSSLKDSIDQTDLANLNDYFVDPTPEIFTDEHAPDYSSSLRFDVYDDDFLEVEFDADNVYDNPFDSKGEKIKESELLIDELDLPCDFLPYFELSCFQSQPDFHKPDEDFSCAKWKEHSYLGCSSVSFLSPSISSNCNEAPGAKAVLMANLSIYDLNVISEVPITTQDNYVLDNCVQEMYYSVQLAFDPASDIEITSDSNIISYAQYLNETESAAVQNIASSEQQNVVIMSVFEEITNRVAKCNAESIQNKNVNESLTVELKRYKERV
nr:reverse transcriptase domain-containing protein [Tanacetum cinerariifolium]